MRQEEEGSTAAAAEAEEQQQQHGQQGMETYSHVLVQLLHIPLGFLVALSGSGGGKDGSGKEGQCWQYGTIGLISNRLLATSPPQKFLLKCGLEGAVTARAAVVMTTGCRGFCCLSNSSSSSRRTCTAVIGKLLRLALAADLLSTRLVSAAAAGDGCGGVCSA